MNIRTPHVLVVTNMYPTSEDPTYGAFVASQVSSIVKCGVGVDVEFVNGRRSRVAYLKAIPALRRLAKSRKYDLVHAHYGLTGFIASLQRLPLVVSFCGDDLLGTPTPRGWLTGKSRLVRRLSHLAAHRADVIICKSEGLRGSLPRARDRERALIIPNGVDLDLFRPGDRQKARERLGIAMDERLILFPSTPTELRKRVDLARTAVAKVQTEEPRARLIVIQNVPPYEMPDYYRAADCLLLTSDWEGSPNVVKEALCCDLPVVSVDAGDVPRWLNLVTGCQLVERNVESISNGIKKVFARGTRVDGHAIREEIGAPRVARQILAAYRQALALREPVKPPSVNAC